jgi:hypothetical protein
MVRVLEGWTDWFVGSGPWRVGLIGLLVLVLVRVLLGWPLCYLDAGREKQSIF